MSATIVAKDLAAGHGDRALFAGLDLVVAAEGEDEVGLDRARDRVVAAGATDDVEPACARDSGHGEAEAVAQRIQTERFAERYNRSAYTSKAMKVSGLSAWRVQYHLAFIDAKVRHWKFNADTISVVVVDRGQGKYGFLWTSVPDTFANQGDLDHVVASLKVP